MHRASCTNYQIYIGLFFLVLSPVAHISSNPLTGLFRLAIGYNIHTVQNNNLYRSATLPPKLLTRTLKKYNIQTVINLRGAQPSKSWYHDEVRVTKKLGVSLHNIPMRASLLPKKAHIQKLIKLYRTAPRPILIHCHAGVDRTGEAAALWKLVIEKEDKETALEQLSDSYGHFETRYPAKKLFINLWQSEKWLAERYNPESYNIANHTIRTRADDNFHTVQQNKLYRSAHLKPSELALYIKIYRIKTVINLVGAQPGKQWYLSEKSLCRDYHVKHYDIKLPLDSIPTEESLRSLLECYEHAPKPILIHCREGSDRTGEAAAIWKLAQENCSITTALEQLAREFGHWEFFHPAHKYFIRNWVSTEWAENVYRPELLEQYHPR